MQHCFRRLYKIKEPYQGRSPGYRSCHSLETFSQPRPSPRLTLSRRDKEEKNATTPSDSFLRIDRRHFPTLSARQLASRKQASRRRTLPTNGFRGEAEGAVGVVWATRMDFTAHSARARKTRKKKRVKRRKEAEESGDRERTEQRRARERERERRIRGRNYRGLLVAQGAQRTLVE